MLTASLSRCPATRDFLVRSLPARSTRCSFDARRSTSDVSGSGGSCCCSVTITMACERLDWSLRDVALVCLVSRWSRGSKGTCVW
eukprot:21995-Chlamydomonas_euryale.AAC.2